MRGFLAELFQNSPYSQILLFLWGALGIVLAIRQGFFLLPPSYDRQKIPVSFFSTLSMFVAFFLSSMFIGPLFLFFLQQFSSSFPIFGISFSSFSMSFQILITFLIIVGFSFLFQKESFFFFFVPPIGRPSMAKNILIGFVSCWILFPVVTFVHQLLATITLYFFHLPELPDQVAIEFLKTTLSSPFAFFLALLVIIVLAPITEELLFRGYLQNCFKKNLGRGASLFLSSLAFAFFHFSFSQGPNNIPIICSLFILGLGLGFVYERQNSLSAPILLHSFFNLFNALNLAYLQGSP